MGTAFEQLRAMAPTISVGMLTADLLDLGAQLKIIEQAGVGIVHVDVMDGVFCPMMTVGPPMVKALRTSMLKDVHLMIDEPLEKVQAYVDAGADIIAVHAESASHPHRVLQAMGKMTNANDPERGIVRGICLNPGTPLEMIEPLLDEAELVVLLAINPGWGGQSFIPATEKRLARVREMIAASGRDILTMLDGGITRKNIAEIAAMGPDLIVTGSAVFDGKAPAENARTMLGAVQK